MKGKHISWLKEDERGATAMITGLFVLFVGLGCAAFAIDFSYRHVVRNELQNAADAGALAGARALYYGDGSAVNHVDGGDPIGTWPLSANHIAFNAATANQTSGGNVEVYNWSQNEGNPNEDVQRGHWSFGLNPAALARGFYCDEENASAIDPIVLSDYTEEELDANKLWINAVRVRTSRDASRVRTFFGRIFGVDDFGVVEAEAVAYVGFSGGFGPGEFDQPIAICDVAIKDPETGELTCNIGRLINSSGNLNTSNTGAWTDFQQDCVPPGGGNTSSSSVRPLICAEGNPEGVEEGYVGTIGGNVSNVLDDLMECWIDPETTNEIYDEEGNLLEEVPIDQVTVNDDGELVDEPDGIPDNPWIMVLPVIICPVPGGQPPVCAEIDGAVTVKFVWMVRNLAGGQANNGVPIVPEAMYNSEEEGYWTRPPVPDGMEEDDDEYLEEIVWPDFASTFGLVNQLNPEQDPAPAPLHNSTMYFLPACEFGDPIGPTGGGFYGNPAEIPVLVK
jgi:hypothetical protein